MDVVQSGPSLPMQVAGVSVGAGKPWWWLYRACRVSSVRTPGRV